MTRSQLDQGIAPRVAELLRAPGCDAIHVSEIGMSHADDIAILARSLAEDRACVTLAPDSHAHLAFTHQLSPSVVLLRVQGMDAVSQSRLIQRVFTQCEEALRAGAAVSSDGATIRVRQLPLKLGTA